MPLYRDGDIDIYPEFQRIFRWNSTQKSRLIESILLGIPIPPIFVSQRDDGVWDVIDGVQRLSTVLEFVGEYRDDAGQRVAASVLTTTEYLPALKGYRWENSDDPAKAFSESLRRDGKRAKLEFRIIREESDANAKFDLFQRLNSGAQLSMQEARNCLLVMMNVSLFNKITAMSSVDYFVTCVPLSERQEDQAYRQELVLRFFAQGDFQGSDSQLTQEYGEYSFRRWDPSRGSHLGPFSIACFEFVTSGLLANVHRWTSREDALRDRVREVWTAAAFRDNSGTGVSPRRRVPRLVLGARAFFAAG